MPLRCSDARELAGSSTCSGCRVRMRYRHLPPEGTTPSSGLPSLHNGVFQGVSAASVYLVAQFCSVLSEGELTWPVIQSTHRCTSSPVVEEKEGHSQGPSVGRGGAGQPLSWARCSFSGA